MFLLLIRNYFQIICFSSVKIFNMNNNKLHNLISNIENIYQYLLNFF